MKILSALIFICLAVSVASAQDNSLPDRLNKIILPRIEFRDATPAECAGYLTLQAGKIDKESNISITYDPGKEPAPDTKIAALSLSNIPLRDAIYYVALLGHLKVTLNDKGVILQPLPPGDSQQDNPLAPDPHADKTAITAKLNGIVLKQLTTRKATLREVMDYVHMKSTELDVNADPAKRGVNLILNSGENSPDKQKFPPEPTIDIQVCNIPMGDALHYYAMLGGLKVTVDPHAVVFERLTPGEVDANDPLKHTVEQSEIEGVLEKANKIVVPVGIAKQTTVRNAVLFLQKMPELSFDKDNPSKAAINVVLNPGPDALYDIRSPFDVEVHPPSKDARLGEVLTQIASQAGLVVLVYPHALVLQPLGDYPFSVEGKPGFEVTLDRKYEAIEATDAKVKRDSTGYMFNPRDGQSALIISIGKDVFIRSDEDLKKDKGFSGVKRTHGTLAGQDVEWRFWSDDEHMYRDCSLELTAQNDPSGKKYKVSIWIVANNTLRRDALAKRMDTIRLSFPQAGKPAASGTAASPANP